MNLPWNDPDADPLGDMLAAMKQAEEDYYSGRPEPLPRKRLVTHPASAARLVKALSWSPLRDLFEVCENDLVAENQVYVIDTERAFGPFRLL